MNQQKVEGKVRKQDLRHNEIYSFFQDLRGSGRCAGSGGAGFLLLSLGRASTPWKLGQQHQKIYHTWSPWGLQLLRSGQASAGERQGEVSSVAAAWLWRCLWYLIEAFLLCCLQQSSNPVLEASFFISLQISGIPSCHGEYTLGRVRYGIHHTQKNIKEMLKYHKYFCAACQI